MLTVGAGDTPPLKILVRPDRFELPTPWFEAKCSIQMSYGRVKLILRFLRFQRKQKRQVCGGEGGIRTHGRL